MLGSQEILQVWSPFLDYLAKMETELKCSICNSLLRMPKLLLCDHVFCSDCITSSTKKTSVCPACDLPFLHKDTRYASHMERIVSLFQEMDAAIGTIIQRKSSLLDHPDARSPLKKYPVSGDSHIEDTSPEVPYMPQKKSNHVCSCSSPLTGPSTMRTRDIEENHEVVLTESMNFVPKSGVEASLNQGEPYCPPTFCENGVSNSYVRDKYFEYTTRMPPTKAMTSDPFTSQEAKGLSQIKDGSPRSQKPKKQKLNKKHGRDNISQHLGVPSIVFGDECAFCHSFRITQASGPMCCYTDGKLVALEEANQSDAIRVHQKCVEWSPQIYFSGETVKNLEVELQRASALKCSKCGLKGAALGCYYESCHKSFHVPCAVEIPDCRWDCVNFLVLCPSHSSKKLPCDENSENNAENTHFQSTQKEFPKSSEELMEQQKHQSNQHCAAVLGVKNEWILLGSDLVESEKDLMAKFCSWIGETVTETWRPDVTHVIASTNEDGECNRTHNLLMAILNGKWVVTTKWIKACMEVGHLVQEEPYEIRFDVQGFVDGPKKGRLRAMEKAPKLFIGLSFHLSDHFSLSSKQSLQDLVMAGGGRLLELTRQDHIAKKFPALYFVYNEDPPKEYNPGDLVKVKEERCEEAVETFKKTGARVISHTRLLDAIAALDILYLNAEGTPAVILD